MFQQLLTRAGAWLDTPIGSAILVWILVSLVTAMVKPRTPEAYARLASRRPTFFWPRFTAFLQFLGGLGIDPVKVALALAKILTGHTVPADAMKRGAAPSVSADDDPSTGSGGLNRAQWQIEDATTLPSQSAAAPVSPPQERRLGSRLFRAVPLATMIAALVLAISLAFGSAACSQQDGKTAKDVARTTLDVVQVACVVANAAMPESKVAEICGITGPFMKPMKDLLASARAAGATPRSAPVICAATNDGVDCWAVDAGAIH